MEVNGFVNFDKTRLIEMCNDILAAIEISRQNVKRKALDKEILAAKSKKRFLWIFNRSETIDDEEAECRIRENSYWGPKWIRYRYPTIDLCREYIDAANHADETVLVKSGFFRTYESWCTEEDE